MEVNFASTDMELDEDQDDVQLSPAQIIQIMEEAWINEKFAPEILPHKIEIVDCLLGQINYMQENVRNLDSTDYRKCLHQLEIDRIRFIISCYLRHRLEKIETFVFHILSQEEKRLTNNEELYLSENELEYAKNYKQDLLQHFQNIMKLYPGIPAKDWTNQSIVPNLHSIVFLKSKGNVEGIVIDEGNESEADLVDLDNGSQIIISYYSVANLVKKGDVHLI